MKLLRRIRSSVVGRYKQWAFRPYVIERQFAGEHFQFQIGDLFGEASYGLRHERWPELEWIKAHGIRPGDVVVDCGANHGFSTVLFAKWTGPQGKVFAFEPSTHNVAILKENLRLNGITNVTCHQAAVGAQPGTVAISASHSNAGIVANPKETQRTEQVSLVALDDTLPAEPVGFLKVDVEGYELEVLKGARRILASLPRLDVELHVAFYRNRESELREILCLIPMHRYTVHVQVEVDGPIVPYEMKRHSIKALSKWDLVHLLCY